MRDFVQNSRSDFAGRKASNKPARRKRGSGGGFILLAIVCGVAAIFPLALHLGSELVALAHNQERIRDLQIENNDLKKRLDERRDRLKNLKENFSDQELEIRRNLHLYRPGDTVFIIPSKPDSESSGAPASGN